MRSTIFVLVLLTPVQAFAQEVLIRASAERLVSEAASRASDIPLAVDDTSQPAGQTPPPSAPAAGRRRPSLVGYIGDSSIGSQVRIRFDAGFEVTAADRAEVFYAKCGCYRDLPASHPAYDPDAPGPGPGIATELQYQQLYLVGEYAMNGRASVYGELPIRWLQPQSFVPDSGSFESSSGLGDVKGGIKVALTAARDHAVTVQLQADAPSGDASRGLGTDHWSISPTLLYLQRLGERVAVESQVGSLHPIGGSAGIPTDGPDGFAGSLVTYGIGASVDLTPGRAVSVAPVVELFGWHVLSGFQTATLGPADGVDIVNLKIGARLSYGDHGSVYFGYGRALTDAAWYHDVFRMEYRYGF
jgi:Putative MetA-pathway of phenol degradation